MDNCKVCERKPRNAEPFFQLSWQDVDVSEYDARKADGRTPWISYVCAECLYAWSGIDKRGKTVGNILHELDETRGHESSR